jgi:hypothetical protein
VTTLPRTRQMGGRYPSRVTKTRLVELSAEEVAALGEVVERLHRQLQASEGFIDQVTDPPAAGSAIDLAYAEKSRIEYDLAYLAIKAAEDHLRTVLWVAEGRRLPSFALYTLTRAAAEALARAWYLLDAPDVKNRRSRALNVRLHSMREQAKLANPRPRRGTPQRQQNQEEIRRAEEIKQHQRKQTRLLEDGAAAVGIAVRRDKNGRTLGFGSAALPDRWEAVADAMDEGEVAYGVMSGFGHSEPWALLRPERARPTDDPDVMEAPTALDLGWLMGILDRVLDLHDRVLARWMALAGQPFEVWQLAKQGSAAARQPFPGGPSPEPGQPARGPTGQQL